MTHGLRQPTALWGAVRRPYPTGAWWTNLVIGKGDNNVAQLPYAVKATNAEGVQVGFGVDFLDGWGRRVAMHCGIDLPRQGE